MSRRISKIPESFDSERERDYWHMAQDIAYRIGASLIERNGASWLESDDGERLLISSEQGGGLWFQTWKLLDNENPAVSRIWYQGFALPKSRR